MNLTIVIVAGVLLFGGLMVLLVKAMRATLDRGTGHVNGPYRIEDDADCAGYFAIPYHIEPASKVANPEFAKVHGYDHIQALSAKNSVARVGIVVGQDAYIVELPALSRGLMKMAAMDRRGRKESHANSTSK